MTAKEMLYEFELSVDRISSKNAVGISLPSKVAYINRGILSFVLTGYEGLKGSSFEQTQRRIQDLQGLHLPDKELTVQRGVDHKFNAALDIEQFMFTTRIQVWASTVRCKNQRMKVYETQTDDLNEVLQDPYDRPSFQWRQVPVRTANNKLEVFTDGTFVISKVVIDYLRMPKRYSVAGFIQFDGTQSTDVPCELPEHTHREIVELAALEFDFDINNPSAQSKAAKLQALIS